MDGATATSTAELTTVATPCACQLRHRHILDPLQTVPQLEQEPLQAMFGQSFHGYFGVESQFPTQAGHRIHLGVSLNEAIATEL